MRLDVGPADTRKVLDLALRGVERVADRDIDVGVRRVVRPRPVGRDRLTRQAQVDRDPVDPALVLVLPFGLDADVAPVDAVIERFDLLRMFADGLLDRVGRVDVAVGDLDRNGHGVSQTVVESMGQFSCPRLRPR